MTGEGRPVSAACAVIVNWNGWRDTVACLGSLLRSSEIPFPLIVCDNASSDGSPDRIREWAEAAGLPYVEYDRTTAEAGGRAADRSVPLVLVRTGGNLGFAGGTNVGLRYALARGDRTHAWLLNNDTEPDPDALAHLMEASRADPRAGMIGSTLLHHDRPWTVQALGGARYNRWLALTRPIGEGLPLDRAPAAEGVLRQMDYVVAASMLVSREFLLDVGLLAEDYFLYFEELDWAMRARGRYRLGYAAGSIVRHKEGASIGGDGWTGRNKSRTADYHFMRNRILFTRRFAPIALPTVYLGLMAAMLRRVLRGQWDRAAMIARLWAAS
jgi:GT2 family glycosyltransferase